MKYNLAIFDLDGTLFDTSDVNYLSYSQALNEYGITLDYDFYCKECNGKYYKEFLPQVMKCDEVILENIHKNKKNNYCSNLKSARINKHLFNIIDSIKSDYYLAVVTTASQKNCYDILEFFNKKELFDLILTHEDFEKNKPDPEGFVKAMNYFNISPENTVIFEDSLVGIEAARKSNANVFVANKF